MPADGLQERRLQAGCLYALEPQKGVCMNDTSKVKSICMDAEEIERSLTRIAHQILESNKGAANIA